jgi:hypothetical protein
MNGWKLPNNTGDFLAASEKYSLLLFPTLYLNYFASTCSVANSRCSAAFLPLFCSASSTCTFAY